MISRRFTVTAAATVDDHGELGRTAAPDRSDAGVGDLLMKRIARDGLTVF